MAPRPYVPWHQDHESFYIVQNHFDYVNFYMPIIKPDPTKSNICLVPFDVLQREAPRAHDFLVRNGAGHFHPVGGRWLATNDDLGGIRASSMRTWRSSRSLPSSVGDLLLMRGDMVHRTQDSGHRSCCTVVESCRRLHRDPPFEAGCRRRAQGPDDAQAQRRRFRRCSTRSTHANKDEMPLTEMLDIYRTTSAPAPIDPRAF